MSGAGGVGVGGGADGAVGSGLWAEPPQYPGAMSSPGYWGPDQGRKKPPLRGVPYGYREAPGRGVGEQGGSHKG